MESIVQQILIPLVSLLIGAVLAHIPELFPKKGKRADRINGHFVFKYYISNSLANSLARAILMPVFLNSITSALCSVAVQVFKHKPDSFQEAITALYFSVSGGILWSLVTFAGCGSLAFVWYSFANRSLHNSIPTFITGGVVASCVITPLSTISNWLLAENLLEYYAVVDLFNLEPLALLRLYIPSVFYAMGVGAYFAFLFTNVRHDSPYFQLYSLRFMIFFSLTAFLLVTITFTNVAIPNNFFWRSLQHDNILTIWSFYFLLWSASFLLGSRLFDTKLKPVFLKQQTR